MFKKLIYFILTLSLCLCLVSCDYKDTHVRRVDDETLSFKGVNYNKLSDEDPSFSILESRSTTVYVTERTVPAVFSRIFHEDWYGSSSTYMSENEYFISDGNDIFAERIYIPSLAEWSIIPMTATVMSIILPKKSIVIP